MKKINYNLIIGFFITAFLMLLIIIGFFYTPYNPETMSGAEKFMAPSFRHIMGTDKFGRDIFSRVLKGSGTTLLISLSTVFVGAVMGIIIGAFTGYFGGWIDEILMRFNDTLAAFPSIILALVFISVLGPGKNNVILALGLAFIPSFARIVRSEFINYRDRDYVYSAKLMGAKSFRIIFRHILPNAFPVILSSVMIGFNNAILAEASMSYLGIGVQPPNPSLGLMLSEAQGSLFTAPWCAIFPGVFIILLVLGFNLLSGE